MELKNYQRETLEKLAAFFREAQISGGAAAFEKLRAASGYSSEYFSIVEGVPYICLRLPTGGGKTLLGSYAVKITAENFLERENFFVLWLVPTDTIRQQTLKLLRDTRSFYRQVLDGAFNGRVKIFDVTEFRQLLPQDVSQCVNIFVATFQSFRVRNKEGRKVYQSDENLTACFRGIAAQEYFTTDEYGYKSFGNLLAYSRPLMIIDEAHNNSSPLSLEIVQKLRPSAIVELTATPAQNSNVLVAVSAQELKDEAMIKLPIELVECLSWETAIDSAVQKRTALEKFSAREAEYLRPVVLFQAESKDKEITVDVVKKYLIEGAKVPENQIATATGERRELDGVNLLARDCPIRYVITVQALKEGWDCPFAYVFCSLAKIHSPKDAEQLLGRVLRMPYAARRTIDELNKAYAFAVVNNWHEAASRIRDDLINMGFERDETTKFVQTKLFDELKTIEIVTSEPPRVETLNLALQAQTFIDKTAEGWRVTIKDISDDARAELKAQFKRIFRNDDDRLKLWQAITESDSEPPQKISPSERGVEFSIPLLCLDFGKGAEPADRDFLPLDWCLTGNYDTELKNFSGDEQRRHYRINIDGQQVKERFMGDGGELLGGETNWTIDELVGWIAGKILTPDIIFEDLAEFTRRTIERLIAEKKFSLAELVLLRFSLKNQLAEKVNFCRQEARQKNYQTLLFGREKAVRVKKDVALTFEPNHYPAKNFYVGSVEFEKHFYPTVGEMNSEEITCAQLIDANANVETWIRNVDRADNSFWLPTCTDKFYPDFVVKLKDGTFAAVEYKGANLQSNDDSKEKNLVGELWANESGGLCKFLMATKNSAGRSLQTQLREFLK